MAYQPGGAGISISEVDAAPSLAGITSLVVSNASLSSSTGVANQAILITGAGSTSGGYATIAEEGSNLTQRTLLNFIGAGVTAADNSTATRTDVTIPSAGALTQIQHQSLSTAAATVTFSSISTAYNHLHMAFYVRGGTTGVSVQPLNMRLNADTGVNYDWDIGQMTTAPAGTQGLSVAQLRIGTVPELGTPTGYAAGGTMDISSYQGEFHKMVIMHDGWASTITGSLIVAEAGAGRWKSTAAVSSISLTLGSGNFSSGCQFTLYGKS